MQTKRITCWNSLINQEPTSLHLFFSVCFVSNGMNLAYTNSRVECAQHIGGSIAIAYGMHSFDILFHFAIQSECIFLSKPPRRNNIRIQFYRHPFACVTCSLVRSHSHKLTHKHTSDRFVLRINIQLITISLINAFRLESQRGSHVECKVFYWNVLPPDNNQQHNGTGKASALINERCLRELE